MHPQPLRSQQSALLLSYIRQTWEVRLELTLMILEIIVLPLNYTLLKYIFGLGGIWTHIVYMQSKCSTNWTTSPSGWGRIRTYYKTGHEPDKHQASLNLIYYIWTWWDLNSHRLHAKQMFYQLNYKPFEGDRIWTYTNDFEDHCSTIKLHPQN